MLKTWIPEEIPEKEELKKRIKEAGEKLYQQQMKLKEHKLPVLVLFEGWGASGKGTTIGRVIKYIDPRFFKVATMSKPTEDELRRPFLYRYFNQIPEAGKFTFLDSGWMEQTCKDCLNGLEEEDYAKRIDSIKHFERQLTDNGYLVLKFFMQIDKKEQTRRIEKLNKEQDTKWRVDAFDKWQNEHYKHCQKVFDRYLTDTNTSIAPWYIIDAKDRNFVELQVLEIMVNNIEVALQNSTHSAPLLPNIFPLEKMPKLSEIELTDKVIEDEEYKKELKHLQKKLGELHNRLYRKRVPVIITYEGWDAAGKGGNIKRITEALDPRGFEVHPIASPEPHEKARHYLWRFWTRLPKDGHIAIFDRTWYGRVMVERLEGFCSENDWKRAYNEINEFEKELSDWGAVIIKFWVQIDKDTQLARFTDRQNNPEKQWKITDEDWRNREKWDAYEGAVDEMLAKTSTAYAPWHILESVDWDAAGKGGNIKRITEALDPRGFEVHPIASPEPHEKARHYLWRFWTRLPKDGHIAIFDRTWYGRVMVERLEGFCSENDWKRAYNEINEFEKELSDWGAVIIKFWVQIDKDTQLARFTDRQNNPEKQWKITDEDWRNREKWDAYEGAVDEMLAKTSTAYAPWHILESVDKKYARIKALKIVIKELEKALERT